MVSLTAQRHVPTTLSVPHVAKKRKPTATPDGLRKLSNDIYSLWADTRTIATAISLHSLIAETAPPELIERINRQLAAATQIWKRSQLLFLFERSYSASHDELKLLGDRYTSFHDRAFKLSYRFLLRLLNYEWDTLPVPECLDYMAPTKLTNLDLHVARQIVEYFREELLRIDCLEDLAAETSAAANLLANRSGPIPAEFRTKVLSKKRAAALLGRPNADSGVRWLNGCIDDGEIRCRQLSRQGFVFDIRDFPSQVHAQIRPQK